MGNIRSRCDAAPVRRRTQGAAVDLGQAERGVFRREDHVAGTHHADATAQDETVGRGDHRHLAVVDGGEGVVAALVHGRDGRAVGGQLLDVDAGAEAAPLGGQHHHPHRVVAAERSEDLGQVGPPLTVEGVHRRVIQQNLGDALLDAHVYGHGISSQVNGPAPSARARPLP
jgi:hypothetical protein